MPAESAQVHLLALPDPCLLAVLQCCAANEQRGLFSAARAHSRLHQAAALALSSVNIILRPQQQADTVLLYLNRHGGHVNSLQLSVSPEDELTLHELPPTLQLHSLELEGCSLQLLPDKGFQGVLGAAVAAGAPPLKQLQLGLCTLLDEAEGLAAALLQLPALEHLCLRCNINPAGVDHDWLTFPTGVLQQLQQLTYLELAVVHLQGPDQTSPALQPLTALTRLVDLQLMTCIHKISVTADMLSGMCHLTRLALREAGFEPAALAGKAKLQHLELMSWRLQRAGRAAGVVQLLSQLQQHTQLTHLDLRDSVRAVEERNPPAAAYAALTASSKLQHLNISGSKVPANVWQHLFPTGRQLLHLTSLSVARVKQLPEGVAAPFEGSRIISCCPNLQSLSMSSLRYSTQQLTQLQGLSGLHTLRLVTGTGRVAPGRASADTAETLLAVCQLTGLRELELLVCDNPTQLLVTRLQHLRQLPHLTALQFGHELDGPDEFFMQEVSCIPLGRPRCHSVCVLV
jgi:hypothetical protein